MQGSENGVAIKGDGEVILYHNASARVTTTSDGADFGGTGSIKVPVGTTGEETHLQPLVTSDTTAPLESLKAILTNGVRLVEVL